MAETRHKKDDDEKNSINGINITLQQNMFRTKEENENDYIDKILENAKDNTNETDKTKLFETREEIIKMEFNENDFSPNNKILEFDLIPFIFIEEYKNDDNVIDIHYNNQYSLINKFKNGQEGE